MPDNIVTVDLRRHLPLETGDLVLDVGCGPGRHTSEICLWDCRLLGIDVNRQDLRVARYLLAYKRWAHEAVGTGDFVQADAQRLPLKDGLFDKIVCTEVLEHVPDDLAVVRELARVLKPGGLLAVSVPSYWPETVYSALSAAYRPSVGHVRIYRQGVVEKMLREAGLEVYAQRLRHSVQALYYFILCAFGVENESFPITRFFGKLVDLHYGLRARPLERLEAALNLVLGKERVFYGRKPAATPASTTEGDAG
ncbi:MAG: class I SAM-dependent methyltransferase [Dehalococcoidia bacterium]|nr:class I SAM-dependent methyltransferase [Dehalococcoidia bacterium]